MYIIGMISAGMRFEMFILRSVMPVILIPMPRNTTPPTADSSVMTSVPSIGETTPASSVRSPSHILMFDKEVVEV